MKAGYKQTKVGLIPEDWELKPLGEIAHVQTGLQKGSKTNGEVEMLPYLRVANVQDGYLELSEVKEIPVPVAKVDRYLLRHGDVLMNEGGDFDKLGRGVVWKGEIDRCVHQNHVFAVRVQQDVLSPYFLNCLTQSAQGRNYFILNSKQSTNLASINSSQLKAFPVVLPPKDQMEAIAQVLTTWDRAIGLQEALLAQKRRLQQGLMQQLLTGKRRLPGFEAEWEEKRLGNLFQRITTKNAEQNTHVVTISANHGFVRQDRFFSKNVASAVIDGYFLVERGDFAYNKSRATGYPMGAIKRLRNAQKAVVTTLYICFRPIDPTDSSADFFEYFFEAGQLNRGLSKIAHVGGRAHGLLNVTPSDFFNLKIRIPGVEEQEAIAKILKVNGNQVKKEEQKLTALRTQKKGLMQQLLTGKRRVPME